MPGERPPRRLQGTGRDASAARGQFAATPRFIFSQSTQTPPPQRRSTSPIQIASGPRTGDAAASYGHNNSVDKELTGQEGPSHADSGRLLEKGTAKRPESIEDSDQDGDRMDETFPNSTESEEDVLVSRSTVRRTKRRHPSSSPATRLTNSRNKRKTNQSEDIELSSSPSDGIIDEAGDESDDSLSVIPGPRNPARTRLESPSPVGDQNQYGMANLMSEVAPLGANRMSPPASLGARKDFPMPAMNHLPPSTPVRGRFTPSGHQAQRFQFMTPLRSPHTRTQRPQSTNKTYDTSVREVPLSTPSLPPPLTPSASQHPHFVFSSGGGAPKVVNDDSGETDVPLPEIFSPQRRGPRFVSGGLAEKVRDTVLEAGGRMHVEPTRRVHVLHVDRVGPSGALAIEAVEADHERIRTGFTHEQETGRPEQEIVGLADDGRHGRRGNSGAAAAGATKLAALAAEPGSGARKHILLVGADETVTDKVKAGDVVKIKHGWNLRLDLPRSHRIDTEVNTASDSSSQKGDDKRQDENLVDWEVCWGPIQP